MSLEVWASKEVAYAPVIALNILICGRAFFLEPFAMKLALIWKGSLERVDNDISLVSFKAVGP